MGATNLKDRVLACAVPTIQGVECELCKKFHKIDSEHFVIFYGDIYRGVNKVVYDGNVDDKGKICGSTVFCIETCLAEFVTRISAVTVSGNE